VNREKLRLKIQLLGFLIKKEFSAFGVVVLQISSLVLEVKSLNFLERNGREGETPVFFFTMRTNKGCLGLLSQVA